ncbi:MAG: ABC transporter ATP-binding protein [Actinomycetota bacterium]|nr:ABC transporter ATP-binding protein [Actinomycetota bacterium]
MSETAVLLENIRKTYKSALSEKAAAVENISLSVGKGEIFGLLGPNGAGKTTTLKVVLGLVLPDEGSGSVLDFPLGSKAANSKTGFLPEQPYFYGFMTARRALDFYGKLFGLDASERESRSRSMLERTGLRYDSSLTLDKYSKGMLQRFGIAQALINDPELLILDEPSSGLDPVGQKEIRDLLLKLRDEGKTILLSSHQLSEVENVCSSVCIVSNGKVAREGKLHELLEIEDLIRIELKGGKEPSANLKKLVREIRATSDGIVAELRKDALLQVIDEASSLEMEIRSITPIRKTLEDLFMEAIKEAR